jgi:hypothetical protein
MMRQNLRFQMRRGIKVRITPSISFTVPLFRGELFFDDRRDNPPGLILLQSLLRILRFEILNRQVRRMITDMPMSER